MREVRFDVPGRGAMRGHASGDGTDMEVAYVRHELADGSFMVETVIRSVEPPPAPEAPPAEPEPPAGGA